MKKTARITIGIVVPAAVACLLTSNARADADFYMGQAGGPEQAAWLAAVTGLETFPTTAENICKADEVECPLEDGTNVGPVLTFDKSNTDLSWSFRIQAIEENFWFNNEGFPPEDELAVGRGQDGYDDDDWTMDVLDGPNLYAFAFDLIENDVGFGPDLLHVYTEVGEYISPVVPEHPEVVFVGVISDSPISGTFFDEDTGIDNIGIANFRFAVPEPGALSLLALGSLVGLRGRH